MTIAAIEVALNYASTSQAIHIMRAAARRIEITGVADLVRAEERHEMISVAAYFEWEKGGRPPGREFHFWIEGQRKLICEGRILP